MAPLPLAIAAQAGFAGFLYGPDPFPAPWTDPGPFQLAWVQSPHCDRRPLGIDVDTVVIHSSVSPTLESVTRWFCSSESQVSAHFTIGKDGSIIQHVSTFDRAWHAGVSEDAVGRTGVNAFSIGIELVNLNDGSDPYPMAQTDALRALLGHLQRRFPLKTVTGHADIARPRGRKSDPAGFPWERLMRSGLTVVHDPVRAAAERA